MKVNFSKNSYFTGVMALLFLCITLWTVLIVKSEMPLSLGADMSWTREAELSYPGWLISLSRFYGEQFTILDSNRILWNDGEIQILDDGIEKGIDDLINYGDIEDQFKMTYPRGTLTQPPENKWQDPGRIRNDLFFRKLYGNSQKEVRKNLKKLKWMPRYSDTELLFNTRYGAWENLKRVSDELEKLPSEYHKYVINTSGTYNWRTIKDTKRLSSHSFGISVDINIHYSHYWKWDRVFSYKNRIPSEIVDIFERYGFIWGGKWYHYDTMHFEYRPELL